MTVLRRWWNTPERGAECAAQAAVYAPDTAISTRGSREIPVSDFVFPLKGIYGNGKYAIVSSEDAELVKQHSWYVTRYGYVVCNNPAAPGGITLHRLVMNAQKGEVVDHINHNRLDNRRTNLRICTQQENNKNNRPRTERKCKGARPVGRRWKAEIYLSGKSQALGYYATEEEAGRAYDAAARYYFGQFAYCNFPEEQLALSVAEIKALQGKMEVLRAAP
jgi:hypothetical protein